MLKNWKAVRSGATITLTGVLVQNGKDDEAVKITGVEEIRAVGGARIVAYRGGESWTLVS